MDDDSRDYKVRVIWTGDKSGKALVEGMPPILTGMPPNYGGELEFHSPEDLLVAAASTCLMNSFVEFTRKMRIDFKSFEIDARGVLEKVGRSYEITKLFMHTKVTIGSENHRKRFERALELGAKYCFVANSLKATTTYSHDIVIEE